MESLLEFGTTEVTFVVNGPTGDEIIEALNVARKKNPTRRQTANAAAAFLDAYRNLLSLEAQAADQSLEADRLRQEQKNLGERANAIGRDIRRLAAQRTELKAESACAGERCDVLAAKLREVA